MALQVGSRLGHYDVTALIGKGGMGQVYNATDTTLNRQVAPKILPKGESRRRRHRCLRFETWKLIATLASVVLVYEPVAADETLTQAAGSLEAMRLEPEERIALDGVLDEAVWKRATPATNFLQQEPDEGAPATERTEVRVVYDTNQLYIGAMLFDSDPSGIIGFQKERDRGLGSDDRFMWILDTFRDGRTGYFFETNPAGLLGDGLLQTGGRGNVNKDWDGIWDLRVRQNELGWSVEIWIPFRTLNFDPASDTWGINFQRTVRRKNEEALWRGHLRNQGVFRPIHAGQVVGFDDVSQGLGLDAKPYVAGAWRSHPQEGVTQTPADVGVDVEYSVTTNLRAALTVNTDFAEAEVDDRRVNLTRFPLFFPERRQFFLEGSSVYQFAERSNIRPFFSRRIGLVEGEAIPIRYGARLGGQAGAFDIGFLQVRTGQHDAVEAETVPGEDFTIARLRRNILQQSSLGVIYTRRSTEILDGERALPTRHTLGVDFNLFTSTFMQDKNFQLEAFYVVHTDPEVDADSALTDRNSRGFRVNYPNDIWNGHVSFREFGEAWDPAVGFAPRNGFRRIQPSIGFEPRPDWPSVRQLQFEVSFEYLTDLDNTLETRSLDLQLFGLAFDSGDEINVSTEETLERIDGPFEITDDVIIPVGIYTSQTWSLAADTAGHRRVSGGVELRRGGFWSGDQTRYAFDVTVRPGAAVQLRTEWEHVDVDLPEGAFSTDLVRIDSDWPATPRFSLTSTVQYDTVSERLGLFGRLRWTLRPGSDLYVVYTHNWLYEAGRALTESRSLTTKVNYTHRF